LGDQPTDRHARKDIEQRQHRLEDRTADILPIDVDAAWASRLQPLRKIRPAVIDAIVEAELVLT
jgi:hypothetical protein